MAYSKQNWADGQTITAAKLNAMDDGIAEALSSDYETLKGNILNNVTNAKLAVTLSGDGAFPKKLAVSGRNIVQMPTSGSGDVNGVHYEFTPDGLSIHGTLSSAGGPIVELAPNLVDNGIRIPDGFYLSSNNVDVGEHVTIAIWADTYVMDSKNPGSGHRIGATNNLTHICIWGVSGGDVNFDGLKIAIVYGGNNSDFTNGTSTVYNTGVIGAFTGDDSATVNVPAFNNDGNMIVMLTDSAVAPSFSTELAKDYSAAIELLAASNPLWGKHYHACGDSFTAGASLTDFDPSNGEPMTANYLVAKYNNMKFTKDAIGGSDMTNVSGASKPFSVDRYLNIPEDTDYLTLQFGLNELDIADEPSTLGTSADSTNTTMWGAYNTVFEWILTNRPNAKVGVIIADSWMTETYANALIDICKFWGVPWLDLGGDPQVSLNIGGRRGGSGTTLSDTAKSLRDHQFKISDTNAHPNAAANRWRYTALQEFLRRL